MNSSAWRILRSPALILAAAGLFSGCVVVVDGEHGEDREWDVSWGGDRTVDRVTTSDQLAKDVSGRIATTSGLSGQDITVSSRDGVVTLHGRVDSVAALEEAMAVAAATPGVTSVVSRLTVVKEAG